MGFFQKLQNKFFSEGRSVDMFAGGAPQNPDTANNRAPVNTDWLLSPIYGQPRDTNIGELRQFAKSPWVQMVLNTIKREISIIPYELPNVDDKDEQDYESEKLKVREFFDKINSNAENLTDLMVAVINDIAEIDSGVWVKIYTNDSYVEEEVEVRDELGNVKGVESRLMLKPVGERELSEMWYADGGSFLKKTDPYRRIKGYYQYSFKTPLAVPKYFDPEEIIYFMMNRKSYSTYGFSPLQSIQQVVELLIQSTRWNKDFFKNNAIPDGLVSLPGISPEGLKQFKEGWKREVQGKPHKLVFHNADANFTSFMSNSRDLEWLDGQKWFFHLVFGVYGLSPTEAGFHENVNQGNQAGQERVSVRNAIRPYLAMFERYIYSNVISEVVGVEKPPFTIRFISEDHAQEKVRFDNDMAEIDRGSLTINEYRNSRGRDDVAWGDEPKTPVSPLGTSQFSSSKAENPVEDADTQRKKEEKNIYFKKAFERFVEIDS